MSDKISLKIPVNAKFLALSGEIQKELIRQALEVAFNLYVDQEFERRMQGEGAERNLMGLWSHKDARHPQP